MLVTHAYASHARSGIGCVMATPETLAITALEVAFDSVHRSRRHKSGLAMRFPRIAGIRSDRPPHEADRIEALAALVRD